MQMLQCWSVLVASLELPGRIDRKHERIKQAPQHYEHESRACRLFLLPPGGTGARPNNTPRSSTTSAGRCLLDIPSRPVVTVVAM